MSQSSGPMRAVERLPRWVSANCHLMLSSRSIESTSLASALAGSKKLPVSLSSVLRSRFLGFFGHARLSVLVLLTLLASAFTGGCGAGRSSVLRSANAKEGEQIVLTRRPRAVVVELNEAAFDAAMFRLAADVHARPRSFGGLLAYTAWQPQGGVERELTDGFRLWCGWKQSKAAKSGCESILEGGGHWLELEPREAMALSIAMSSVWDGAIEAVKGMVDPVAFQALVYTSLATCMTLLLIPEPITKALTLAITVGLCTYLGWSTVWGILQGWKWLRAEASAARTFEELSAAGERFGKLLGANTARVMVMVTTMALGSTAGMAIKTVGPNFAARGQAMQLATVEGLAPALAFPAASVLAVEETITISMALASNDVMAAQATPESGSRTNLEDQSNEAGDHIVIGLRNYGLEKTAAQVGGRTLLSDPNWKSSLLNAISDPRTKFSVSVDGLAGPSTAERVLRAVQQGIKPGATPTNWELAQLYQAGRLKDVTFLEQGAPIPNPFQ